MTSSVSQQSCDITLQPWDVAQQLWDVTQQLWDSHKTPWDVAVAALRLSHCLVARALWLLHSYASDGMGTQKKGIMCKPATQNNPQSWLCMFQNCTYFVMWACMYSLLGWKPTLFPFNGCMGHVMGVFSKPGNYQLPKGAGAMHGTNVCSKNIRATEHSTAAWCHKTAARLIGS